MIPYIDDLMFKKLIQDYSGGKIPIDDSYCIGCDIDDFKRAHVQSGGYAYPRVIITYDNIVIGLCYWFFNFLIEMAIKEDKEITDYTYAEIREYEIMWRI